MEGVGGVRDGFWVANGDDDGVGLGGFDGAPATEGFGCGEAKGIAVEDVPGVIRYGFLILYSSVTAAYMVSTVLSTFVEVQFSG